jgi:hypothetical protein
MKKGALRSYLLVLLISSSLVSCSGLFHSSSEVDKMNLNDLLITIHDVPAHWSTNGSGKGIDPARSTDSSGIGFYSDIYPDSLGISQNIYRFSSIGVAKDDFSNQLTFYDAGQIPQGWSFKSTAASESRFSCTNYSNVSFPVCNWIARYDRIVIEFGGWLVPARMTLSDMEAIVRTIDSKASKLVLTK